MNIISQRSIKKIELKNRPKVILTPRLVNQIAQAHYFAGKTEWSGLLLFEEIEGSIEDPDNLVLKCDYLHLMDVGSEVYTEIDINNNIQELNNEFPDFVEYKIGKIHTHHNMNCFHSSTDMACLEDNAPTHNYYLSLIVNYEGKYDCKIGMIGKEQGGQLFTKNEKPFNFTSLPTQEVMFVIDCNIEFEPLLFATNETFQSRVEKLRKIKESRTINTYRQPSQAGSLLNYKPWANQQVKMDFDKWEQPWHQPTSEGRKQFNAWTDDKYEDTSIISNNRFETITDLQYEDFLIKWMNHDLNAEGLLITNLNKLEKRYSQAGSYMSELAEIYLDTLEANFWELAGAFFEEKTFTTPEKSSILNNMMLVLDPFTNDSEFGLELYLVLQQQEELIEQKEELTWQQEMEMYDRT